jgi:hypothetical protein
MTWSTRTSNHFDSFPTLPPSKGRLDVRLYDDQRLINRTGLGIKCGKSLLFLPEKLPKVTSSICSNQTSPFPQNQNLVANTMRYISFIISGLLVGASTITGMAVTSVDDHAVDVAPYDFHSNADPNDTSDFRIPDEEVESALSRLDFSNATSDDLNAIFRVDRLFCETSGASPHIIDVHDAANQIQRKLEWNMISEKRCEQTNPFGSKCTRWATVRSGDLGICGKFRGWLQWSTFIWATKYIADNCVNGSRKTGGWYDMPSRKVYVVIY